MQPTDSSTAAAAPTSPFPSSPAAAAVAPAQMPAPGFSWFYHRADAEFVIGLCAGHAYLADADWKPGTGVLGDLGPANVCCSCMGTATEPRMLKAPLKPVAPAQVPVIRRKFFRSDLLSDLGKRAGLIIDISGHTAGHVEGEPELIVPMEVMLSAKAGAIDLNINDLSPQVAREMAALLIEAADFAQWGPAGVTA